METKGQDAQLSRSSNWATRAISLPVPCETSQDGWNLVQSVSNLIENQRSFL